MKKYFITAIFSATVIFFSNCHTPRKAMASTTPKVSYEANVKAVVLDKCSPCHVPSKGGNKKALDNYDGLKSSIDDAIRRIQLNPTDKGFMPFRGTKLSDSTIAVFTQWRDAGTPQ